MNSKPDPGRAPYARQPPPDPAWTIRGACARHPDPDLWFTPGDPSRQEQATVICRTCPVKAPCLDYALSVPGLAGIWGGTTTAMRTRLRNRTAATDAA